MNTKVFNLVQRNSLILRHRLIRRLISFRVRPKRTNLNFSSGNCSCWVYNNSQERLLVLLVQHLSRNINPRQPASVTRMRMVPPNNIFQSPCLYHSITTRLTA
ncbi:hypothetical protein Hanom_Chr17g01524901 [Helianthus anomalus]